MGGKNRKEAKTSPEGGLGGGGAVKGEGGRKGGAKGRGETQDSQVIHPLQQEVADEVVNNLLPEHTQPDVPKTKATTVGTAYHNDG